MALGFGIPTNKIVPAIIAIVVVTVVIWIVLTVLGIGIGLTIGAGLVALFDPDRFIKGTLALILLIAGVLVLWKGFLPGIYRYVGAGALFVGAYAMWAWGMA